MHSLHVDGVVHDELIEIIERYGPQKIDDVINHENDYNFDYFAWRSLQEMYLLKTPQGKVVERPQHMYMRVGFCGLLIHSKKLWNIIIPFQVNVFRRQPQS